MKFGHLLPLAAIGSAFVIPDQETFASIESQKSSGASNSSSTPAGDRVLPDEADAIKALEWAGKRWSAFHHHAEEMIEEKKQSLIDHLTAEHELLFEHAFDGDQDPFHQSGGCSHCSDQQSQHEKPDRTVYELINESKFTTKFAHLINKYEDMVTLLNGTSSNFTVFVPLNSAFGLLSDCRGKVCYERIKKLVAYHVSTEFYPAERVLTSQTIPSTLSAEYLGGKPQRVSTQVTLIGPTLNYYARIVAVDIFGTNGVIHGLDLMLVPPPNAVDLIALYPSELGTLESGLIKTGLAPVVNDTSKHVGGTLFAPSNSAFALLGPNINAFLFSEIGLKYLKVLLKYHIAPNNTLYSDALYRASTHDATERSSGIPKDGYHVELPTALKDRSLEVDIIHQGRLLGFRVNGFSNVAYSDAMAADGAIHVISTVLIPPKEFDGSTAGSIDNKIELEDLIARLEPFVEADEGEDFFAPEL